jgi:alanyl-tRNA synthetase
MPYINKIAELVGTPYDYNASNSASYRVIADHLRSCSFLLAQGINFDKDGRGYVLRRIMRRAIRHGYLLGLREPFMYKMVNTLVESMGKQYHYLVERAESIKASMKLEEERFFKTIEDGIKLFNQELKNTTDMFNGEVAFKLNDTYGFPLDLTEDMLREKNIKLDIDAFNKKLEAQKVQSKAGWKGTGDAAATGDFKELKESFGLNEFVGYNKTSSLATVLALLDENFKRVEEINGKGWVFLSSTPFYAESGGQVGDTGILVGRGVPSPTIKVTDTKKFLEMNLSLIEGSIKVCEQVEAIVDDSRIEVERHHSATHLLHAGLREILGDHIAQAGSLNDDKRLRFDFSHPQAMTNEELEHVEAWVNDKISRNITGMTKVMSIDEAKNSGAMALFGEKYGDEVRVVSFGDASVELCGGTHVKNASEIGLFMITKESGVSAGVRRIEAVCSKSALSEVHALRASLNEVKVELKNQNPMAGINKLKEDVKTLKSELKTALNSTKKELTASEVNGVTAIVEEVEAGDIKELIDEAKNKYPNVAIMLFQKKGDKVLIACGSKETNVKAGNWIKAIAPILGGGGGGRPDFAQAGGKDASKIGEAKEKALAYLQENL